MNSRAPWRQEIFLVTVICLFAWWSGNLYGQSYWPVAACLLLWMGWHLYNLWRLLLALESGMQHLPLATPGLWGYVYYRIQLRSRKSQANKTQVQRLLKEFTTSTKALPDAAIVLNHRFEIQWSNKAARQLLKLRKSDSNRPITGLLREPAFLTWLRDDSRSEVLEMLAPADTETVLALRLTAYSPQRFLLIARDITEHKRLDKLRQNFIANASHELRTPLTVIQGTLEQLSGQLSHDPDLEKPLSWMKRQSSRMQSILEDLLVLARIEGQHGKREDWQAVSVAGLLDTIFDDALVMSDGLGGHSLDFDIDRSVWILGQRDPLYTLFNNLVTNAVRYTPAGGKIAVSWLQSASGARFEVRDNGPGIAIRHIPRLTERFYRVEESRSRSLGGTGLGLAIVKHVLDFYLVRLEITSALGQGARFGFTIPKEYLASEPILEKQ